MCLLPFLDSTLKCNRPPFVKDLVRRSVAERLARPLVEPPHHPLHLRLGNLGEIRPLREVLPQQPVRVLVDTALPTRVRPREVEARPQPRGDAGVMGELPAVIRGDRQHTFRQRAERRQARPRHLFRALALDPAEPHQLRLALDQAQDGPAASAPDDGVGLPVADSPLGPDDPRPLLDADAPGDLPAPRVLPVTLAPLPPAAQVEVERAAGPLVGVDVAVDALVARRRPPFEPKAARDLLGAPVPAQQRLDHGPGLGADARPGGGPLPRLGQLMREGGAVGAPPSVAAQLARDRRLMDADEGGCLCLAVAGFLQGVNLVSLLAGKLRVTHQCASLTWRLRKHTEATAAYLSIANLKVALQS